MDEQTPRPGEGYTPKAHLIFLSRWTLLLAHHVPNCLTREISPTNHLKVLKKTRLSEAVLVLGTGERQPAAFLTWGERTRSEAAVFGLISHLTAGLASGNRKYDISALTCRNVGTSGCLLALCRNTERAGRTRQTTHN